jgi:hypothetical protein
VRIRVASNTVAMVWSANTTHRITVPAASIGAINGQVPTVCLRRITMRRMGRPPATRAATAISPVGWIPSVNAAEKIASAAGANRPELTARSIST